MSSKFTLGFEVEAVIVDVEKTFGFRGPEKKVYQVMADTLSAITKHKFIVNLPHDNDNNGTAGPDFNINYKSWSITNDKSILALTSESETSESSDNAHDRMPFELVSPILRYWDGSWKAELEAVIEGLTKAFPQCKVNESTGLHIGRSEKSWEMWEIKNLTKMVLLFEGVIDSFHHGSRSIDVHSQNPEIASNRHNSKLAPLTQAACFQAINGAKTQEEIFALVNFHSSNSYDGYSKSRGYKVNFTSLNKFGTIEFRQHKATLEVTRIECWIEFLVTFFLAAISFCDDDIVHMGSDMTTLEIIVGEELCQYLKDTASL